MDGSGRQNGQYALALVASTPIDAMISILAISKCVILVHCNYMKGPASKPVHIPQHNESARTTGERPDVRAGAAVKEGGEGGT